MLCPDLYLGVESIGKRGKRVELGSEGDVVEYAVKMVELPQESRMDHLLEKDRVRKTHLRAIARILADFHGRTGPAPKKYGSLDTIKDNFAPAFEAKKIMAKFFPADKVDAVKSRAHRFMEGNNDLFRKRVSQKKIRNCHGDVRTKNIFIHEGQIYLFDAIEFSDKISSCDVAAEVAFLTMDLEFYGRQDLGQVFLDRYISDTRDRDIEALIDFYLLAQDEVSEAKKNTAAEHCRKYLDLAHRFAEKL
jgi:hypothetical protein